MNIVKFKAEEALLNFKLKPLLIYFKELAEVLDDEMFLSGGSLASAYAQGRIWNQSDIDVFTTAEFDFKQSEEFILRFKKSIDTYNKSETNYAFNYRVNFNETINIFGNLLGKNNNFLKYDCAKHDGFYKETRKISVIKYETSKSKLNDLEVSIENILSQFDIINAMIAIDNKLNVYIHKKLLESDPTILYVNEEQKSFYDIALEQSQSSLTIEEDIYPFSSSTFMNMKHVSVNLYYHSIFLRIRKYLQKGFRVDFELAAKVFSNIPSKEEMQNQLYFMFMKDDEQKLTNTFNEEELAAIIAINNWPLPKKHHMITCAFKNI